MPSPFLAHILAKLVKARIVKATAGQDGGYELLRAPDDLSLFDVIEAVEDDSPPECVLRNAACVDSGARFCAVHEAWSAARAALRRELTSTSFGMLVKKGHRAVGMSALS